jgi:hypothetical protein
MSHTIQSYWDSISIEERVELLNSLYIQTLLSNKTFFELPSHIRFMFYTKWNNGLEKKVNLLLETVHEINKK